MLHRAKLIALDTVLADVNAGTVTLARSICEELGGLPLALDQAGAYIEETPSTLDGYLKAYKCRQQQLLQQRGNERWYHPDAVATTWSLNFEQVEQLDPMAADLLHFLALLEPDAIPEEIIVAGVRKLGPHLRAVATDETLLDQALRVLSRFSLVRRNTEKHLLSIHRLVQAVLIARMTDQTYHEWVYRTIRAINLALSAIPESQKYEQRGRYDSYYNVCAELSRPVRVAPPKKDKVLRNGPPYRCPCCQYKTLEQRGSYDICPVCFWEDDGHDDMNWNSDPNHITLLEGRENYRRFGASKEQLISYVRPPLPEER